jgi:hypothetical protein
MLVFRVLVVLLLFFQGLMVFTGFFCVENLLK